MLKGLNVSDENKLDWNAHILLFIICILLTVFPDIELSAGLHKLISEGTKWNNTKIY